VAGLSFLYLNSRPCSKSNWWPKAAQGATNRLEQSIKYHSIWKGLPWWDPFCRMVSWYIQAQQHSGKHICCYLWTLFSWTILMLPEMTTRVSSVYFWLFQSSLGSLRTDHGHDAPLGSCLNSRQMIPKDRKPLCSTMSFLSPWGVREAHSLGGLITDILGPDSLQQTITFKEPICLSNGNVEGNDKLCSWYASQSTK
jgi:hypothetical protein